MHRALMEPTPTHLDENGIAVALPPRDGTGLMRNRWNISCLRICLFPRCIQGLSGICIVRIQPQYFAQFQNSILPLVDPA
jgi:hypothetical protein